MKLCAYMHSTTLCACAIENIITIMIHWYGTTWVAYLGILIDCIWIIQYAHYNIKQPIQPCYYG